MPWKETHVEDQRLQFIAAHLDEDAGWTMIDLCRCFGVSRKTGYKWVRRYEQGKLTALKDLSRAPHMHPNQVPAEIVRELIAVRKKHRTWGARTILYRLQRDQPAQSWPAPSTITEILKRHGLVRARRRRRQRIGSAAQMLSVPTQANDVWGVDYKGWFLTRDGKRCNPLTVSDLHSRYLLECQRVEKQNTVCTQPIFVRLFREYGLPAAIRSDNGSPFGSTGLGGLTRLAVQWVKLGIRLERIVPGRPDQNGCHERMHLTLQRATACPPRANGRAQQRAFGIFRDEFNNQRPHHALNGDVPAQWYHPSPRAYPKQVAEIEYPSHFEVRRVRTSGEIQWRGEMIYVSHTLVGELVGLEMISERHWEMSFGPIRLAMLDAESRKLLAYRRATRRDRKREARAIGENSGRPTGSLRSPQSHNKRPGNG